MKRLIREPLVHFLLLGAAIFAAYHWMSGRDAPQEGRIVVTQARIEHLAAGFARTWQRPPTQDELEGLIRDYVREEIAAREAMALGLDRDDTIIRRRLRQKLEFVAEDLSAQVEPSEDELRAYLAAHPETFRRERRYTFRIDPQDELKMLEREYTGITASEVARQFGEQFAAKLDQLPIGQWRGPVESGYGPCRVLISDRTEGRLSALEEVRDAVRRELVNARRMEASEKFYQVLLQHYAVTIEQPQPSGGTHILVEAKP